EKQLVYFNHCHPIVNAVAGFMIQHRRKPECLAAVLSEQDQQIRSEYINSVSDFFRENANFDHIESKQDLHLIMCGYGVVDTDILYDNEHGSDPEGNGEIDIERVDPNDVFWDPTASETNLLDARYVARRKTFSKDDVERLFSTKLDNLEEEELEFSEEYNINREGNYTKRRDLEYVTGTDEKMVVVHKFQWWDYEKFYRVENPIQYAEDEMQAQLIAQAIMRANEIRNEEEDENYRINLDSPFLVLDKYRFNDIMELLERVEIEPEYVEFDKRVYQTAILSGDKLLDSYKNIHQAGFTIKFKTAFRDDITGLLFGLVTLMREPAKYNTKALTEILRSLANATKTGLFIEKGATDNIKELEYN
ncbi:MAG: hypothetical protein GWN13_28975, partial [Phycisphaerae bacterium]|nr:hypothetical protein [Phycisphaerae bacterium]NIX02201.1 hypothetical protein [Phycisphaerae bacterium]